MALSPDEGVTFLAGRVLSDAGQHVLALELVGKLLKRFDPESLAYARVLEGEIALAQKDPRKAIERFKTAQQFADSWLGRFGLGRAYLEAGAVAEADSEFDLCVKRRGEATAALLDDLPDVSIRGARSLLPGPRRRSARQPGGGRTPTGRFWTSRRAATRRASSPTRSAARRAAR